MASFTRLVRLALTASAILPLLADSETIRPNHDSAKANGYSVFNTIHSAARQWGSSLNHNGLSIFPVTVPKGTLLYHGANGSEIPPGMEWLALDVELSENFALSSMLQKVGQGTSEQNDDTSAQKVLGRGLSEKSNGHIQTYMAHRDLNVVYFDGMSAAKTNMGTFDTQDLIISGKRDREIMDEINRAGDVCDMITKWGFDGLMRMELGFEIIYCDFHVGIDLVTMTHVAHLRDSTPSEQIDFYPWTRSVAQGYDGIIGNKVKVDYSSIVSALFFPVNTTNPDAKRSDLPRLQAVKLDQLDDIRAHLGDVFTKPRRFNVDWQAIVDTIVIRFSSRLARMASSEPSPSVFFDEVEIASRTYFDGPVVTPEEAAKESKNRTADAIRACTEHHLLPAYLSKEDWALEDALIATSIEKVSSDICTTIYQLRDLVVEASSSDEELAEAALVGRDLVRGLQRQLAWTTWKKPQICPLGKVLFLPMWPIGETHDHWQPECRSADEMGFAHRGYWSPYDNV